MIQVEVSILRKKKYKFIINANNLISFAFKRVANFMSFQTKQNCLDSLSFAV